MELLHYTDFRAGGLGGTGCWHKICEAKAANKSNTSKQSNTQRTMALIIEPFYSDGIAQLSYMVGDDSKGVAAVIDPRSDCETYIEFAQSKGMTITAIYETHIHADFMSGALALRQRLGGKTAVRVSREGEHDYTFEHEGLHDGDEATFGELRLVARHTPGHTPEHLSYLAYQVGKDEPFAVFSGDTLFVDSVGRPDLLGDDETDELASQLFHSIDGFYKELPDGTMIYPGHGAGSACGPDIGDRMLSTIGYEKQFNPYFALDADEFKEKVLGSAPEEPRHYRPMKKLNAADAGPRRDRPIPAPLTLTQFENARRDNNIVIVDTRSSLSFAGAHILGSLNIEARGELSVWSGWLLKFDQPLLLVIDSNSDIERVVTLLWRTGHSNIIGYLVGGIMEWIMNGNSVDSIQSFSVENLQKRLDQVQVLDVRSSGERSEGYIPGSTHIFVPDIEDNAFDILDRDRTVVTYCASGFRASAAASILKRMGFPRVGMLPGSWAAWKSAGMPIEQPEETLQGA